MGDPASAPESTAASAESGEVLEQVLARRRELEGMPDGPRPRAGGPYKRRTIFVDWHLQVNYVGVYLATITLLVIGFIALNYVFSALYQRALAIQEVAPFETNTNVVLLTTLNVVLVLLLVIGMAVHAIVQSHRVAGPVYRFRRALHAIQRRDYNFYLQLRSRDHLQDMAGQLNELNEALKARDIVVADAAARLHRLAADHPELREQLQLLGEDLGELILPEEAAPAGEADGPSRA